MMWTMRVWIALLALALLLPVPAWSAQSAPSSEPTPVVAVPAGTARNGTPSAGAMVADAVLVRPLGLAATAIGAAVFLVALPFTAIAGDVGQVGHELVVRPARMTFARPLGQFRH